MKYDSSWEGPGGRVLQLFTSVYRFRGITNGNRGENKTPSETKV